MNNLDTDKYADLFTKFALLNVRLHQDPNLYQKHRFMKRRNKLAFKLLHLLPSKDHSWFLERLVPDLKDTYDLMSKYGVFTK